MISIIIPTVALLPNIEQLKKALFGIDYEIIIEFDRYKEGKGLTLQRGFAKAKGDRIVWLDADFQIPPCYIKPMLKMNADIVIASKFHPMSLHHYSLKRRLFSNLGNIISKILFGIPFYDSQAGLKIFKREVLQFPWQIRGFGHDIEVLIFAAKRGYTLFEAPVIVKEEQQSTVSLRSCWRTLYEMLWLRLALLSLPTKVEI